MLNLNTSILAALPLRVPGITEQQKIVEALGPLDDKIAANSRVVAVAEELMVSLASTAPRRTTVADLARHSTRVSSPELFDATVFHFSLPAFDEGAVPESSTGAAIKSNKFILGEPSVLISKLNPRIPRIWDVCALPAETAVASTEFVILVPTTVTTSALWAALRQPTVSVELASNVSGTSGSHQRVKPAEILSLSVPDPRGLHEDVLSEVDALGRAVHLRRRENSRLAEMRDELLPLLMSGKVRVRDVEQTVGDVL
jgi:type I restriction enzyme S subunit